MASLSTLEQLKGVVLVLLPAVAATCVWLLRDGDARRRWLARALLAVAVLAAGWNYWSWGSRQYRESLVGYDLFHYYLAGKYRAELGTERLYLCALAADQEATRPRFAGIRSVRDLHSYKVVPTRGVLRQHAECTSQFSEARWQDFAHDLRYFQEIVPRREWRAVFLDRGANASPIWHLGGGLAARLIPVEHMRWATHIDTALLGVALGFVVWSFGWEAAAIVLIFLLTCFSTRWPLIGGALFRYDWVAASLISVALLHRQRPAASGAVLAYAAGVRIFPGVLALGLGGRALWDLIQKRRLARREKRFFAGLALASVLLCGLAALDGGPAAFTDFVRKMKVHSAPANVSVMRVGLPVAAAYRGETPSTMKAPSASLDSKRKLVQAQSAGMTALALGVLLGLVWICRRGTLTELELLLLGVAALPLVLQVSYYYYVFLAVPVLLHYRALGQRGHLLAFTVLCWANAAALVANARGVPRYVILAPGSIVLAGYGLAVLVGLGLLAQRRQRLPEDSAGSAVHP